MERNNWRATVLDKGLVAVEDVMGTDMAVLNAARVSFGKYKPETDSLDEADKKLLRYLAKNKHYSPFRHVMVKLYIKAPEFVMRQWYKHVVGCEWSSASATKDHGWNEISGRYTEVHSVYRPAVFREQSTDNKQASAGDLSTEAQRQAQAVCDKALDDVFVAYKKLLDIGVAREQARIILPLAMYTEVYWTASFQAVANFIDLRDHPHAQWEIREYAKVVRSLMEKYFPETMNAWFAQG